MSLLPIQGDFPVSFDAMEAMLHSGQIGEPTDCPLEHIFTPGLYTRKILMLAGSFITSRIHKTRHPFVVLSGDVTVKIEGGKEVRIRGPYLGITEPGTRRALYCHEDTVWITFHTNPDEEDLEQIEKRIIEDHHNPLIGANHSEIAHHKNHTQHVLSYHD